MSTRIFLSHSSRDGALVEPIRAQAVAMGVDVYLFNEDLHPGGNAAQKLQQAIEQSHAVVVLITSNSALSQYVNQEIGFARGRDIPVIPLVESSVPADRLAMLQGVDYIPFNPDDVQPALTQLTRVLRDLEQRTPRHLAEERKAVVEMTQQEVILALAVVALLLLLAYSAGASFGRA